VIDMKTTRAQNKTYSTVAQSLFTISVYSDVDGIERTKTGGQFHALSFKPWYLQVQECIDGVWHMVHSSEPFMRKEQALADAERQGIALDYVSHHKDHVQSWVLGKAA
jgi:hypothetical protein